MTEPSAGEATGSVSPTRCTTNWIALLARLGPLLIVCGTLLAGGDLNPEILGLLAGNLVPA